MWGKHVIADMSAGDRERVRSARHICRFVQTLVETIGMKAYGPPVLEHFAEHVPAAAGYSLVQLSETSAITGHFCDRSGDAYIDIFPARTSRPIWRLAWFAPPSAPNISTTSRLSARPRN
ncbi:MAG: S-adenosylmethionine decarboxylase [Methyloceanibacter sp.]